MDAPTDGTEYKHLQEQSALPGKGGLARIGRAFLNTLGGFREGLKTEAAITELTRPIRVSRNCRRSLINSAAS